MKKSGSSSGKLKSLENIFMPSIVPLNKSRPSNFHKLKVPVKI